MVIGPQPVLEEGLGGGEGWKLQTLHCPLSLRTEELGRPRGGVGRKLFSPRVVNPQKKPWTWGYNRCIALGGAVFL